MLGSYLAPAEGTRDMDVDQILNAIEEDIVFGVLPAQSRLIEERLAERFDAKRHAIREIFARLEDLGLVVRVPNRGAVVNELTPEEVREIYDMREMLETAAARRTRLPADKSVTDSMAEIQERHAAAVKSENFRAVFHLNIEFHRAQYSACSNRHLVRTIDDYARKAHLIRAIKYGDRAHMKKVVAQHWALVDAMKGRDQDKLADLIRAHLPGSPEEYIRSYEIRYGGQRRERQTAQA
jgi:DNA-binding GntR family transcriptional regulator